MIRLERAVIHAYKCIGEGESFEAGKGMTALMGKNEAGKTSVLEALAKANYYNGQDGRFRYDEVYDYPRRRRRELEQAGKPPAAVTLSYTVDDALAERIEREMLIPAKGSSFCRTTDYEGKSRITENGFSYSVEDFLSAYAERRDALAEKFIHPLLKIANGKEFSRFVKQIETELTQEEKTMFERIAPYFENRNEWENPISEYVYRKYLAPAIPKFLYYDEYMMLPSRVSVNTLAEGVELNDSQRMAKALLLLAGIDLNKLSQGMETEHFKSELELIQAEFTEDFLKAWSNSSDLAIEFELIQEAKSGTEKADGKGLFSWIRGKRSKEEQETFLEIRVRDRKNMVSMPLGSRSRGFQWFFSFWVWFKAIQKERPCPFIFLLDEPGLNLHASAQRDFMHLIEDIAGQNQVIFTTHSPYMLEGAGENICCIVDREGGSTIRPLKEETEEETLIPIRMMKKEKALSDKQM